MWHLSSCSCSPGTGTGSWSGSEPCLASFEIHIWFNLRGFCWDGLQPDPGFLQPVHLPWPRLLAPAHFLCCGMSPETQLRPWDHLAAAQSPSSTDPHPPIRAKIPVKCPSQSISFLMIPWPITPSYTFARPLPFRRSVSSSSGFLPWVYPSPLLLIPPLHVGEGPRMKRRTSSTNVRRNSLKAVAFVFPLTAERFSFWDPNIKKDTSKIRSTQMRTNSVTRVIKATPEESSK